MNKLNKNYIPTEELSEHEIAIWKKVAPELIELEVVNSLNYIILVRYCSVSAQLDNYIKNKPNYTSIINSLSKQIRALEDELCLSPKSYNKFLKDKLTIEGLEKKLGKNKEQVVDEYKESFFKK